MELTPNEMKNHQFSSSMRGFDKNEVKAFIEGAADALESAYSRIEQLNRDNEALKTRYEELKNLEDTIKNAALEAQKNAERVINNAKKEAELIIKQAKVDAEKMFEAKKKEMAGVEQKIQKLEYTRDQFYSKLRSDIEAHLKLVDSICPPNKDMKSEELQTRKEDNPDQPASAKEPPKEKEERKPVPTLDMKDDDIEAALENLSETPAAEMPASEESPTDEKQEQKEKIPSADGEQENKARQEAMAEVAESNETSDVKEEVQDGQSKGYDF
jgi:cell division initiation protein